MDLPTSNPASNSTSNLTSSTTSTSTSTPPLALSPTRYTIDPASGRPLFKQQMHVPLRKRIAIIGARGIGKSALLHRAMSDTFYKDYHPTIEDTYVWRTKVDGVEFEITLIDTKGVDEHSAHLGIQYSVACDGYILAFSLSDAHSLTSLRSVHAKLMRTLCATFRYGTTEIPRVLVGMQRDHPANADNPVSTAAAAFARRNGLPYKEVSAFSDRQSDVVNVFHSVIRIIQHNLKASYTATTLGDTEQRSTNLLYKNAHLENLKYLQQQQQTQQAPRRKLKNSSSKQL